MAAAHHPNAGYAIQTEDDEIDLARFTVHAEDAGHAAKTGDWHQVAERLRAALSLWRGEP